MKRQVPEIILASRSPRRRKLLEDAGFSFRVATPDVDEVLPPRGDPHAVSRANSLAKARDVARRVGDGLVVAGDTVVALGDELIGKPAGRAEAVRILGRLSGTRHRVVSSVALVDAATGRAAVTSDETFVTMRAVTPDEIASYVDSGEALGKAGAYAIQETGDRFVSRMEGGFSTVVGFPLEAFEKLLEDFLGSIHP